MPTEVNVGFVHITYKNPICILKNYKNLEKLSEDISNKIENIIKSICGKMQN